MSQAESGWGLARSRIRAMLPVGTPLPDEDWLVRHRTISVIAMLHAPALLVVNLSRGANMVHALEESVLVLALAVLGSASRFSRQVREIATTLALAASSAALVHASGGFIEAHFHFFVVVALVTLYQQWASFAIAIGFVLVHHGIAGMLAPGSVYNHPAAIERPWVWAAVHAAFIAMASAVGIANWKFNETARHHAESYYSELYEGSSALMARLREANQVKSDLAASVSHEFRTPLTAVLGFLHMLESNTSLPEGRRQEIVGRARRQARRLERLVINLLEAERALEPGQGSCDAQALVSRSIAEVRGSHREPNAVEEHVEPGLLLPVDETVASVILVNLIGNALKFSLPDTTVNVGLSRTPDGDAQIEVVNWGPEIPAEMYTEIFEPFTQVDSTSTRRVDGVGLGLHLVKRAVSAHGGSVDLTCKAGLTTFRVRLPQASADGQSSWDAPDGNSDRRDVADTFVN